MSWSCIDSTILSVSRALESLFLKSLAQSPSPDFSIYLYSIFYHNGPEEERSSTTKRLLGKSTLPVLPPSSRSFLLARWVPYAELSRLHKPTGIYYFYFPFLHGSLLASESIPPLFLPLKSSCQICYSLHYVQSGEEQLALGTIPLMSTWINKWHVREIGQLREER